MKKEQAQGQPNEGASPQQPNKKFAFAVRIHIPYYNPMIEPHVSRINNGDKVDDVLEEIPGHLREDFTKHIEEWSKIDQCVRAMHTVGIKPQTHDQLEGYQVLMSKYSLVQSEEWVTLNWDIHLTNDLDELPF